MKKNKTNRVIILSSIFIILIVSLIIFILNYTKDSSSFSIIEKNWINKNKNNVIDISTYNDVPIYGYNGEGIIFSFLEDFSKDYGISFNRVSYFSDNNSNLKDSAFRILNYNDELSDNDILMYEDEYVIVSKEDKLLDDIRDIDSAKLGVFNNDISSVSYYLYGANNISYVPYDNIDDLINAIVDGNVEYIALPNVMYMDDILANDLNIVYHISELKKQYVLTVNNNSTLLSIMKKYNNIYKDNDRVKIINTKDNITISFVGDISLADNFDIMPYYDKRNEGVYGILSKEVVDIMTTSDIMVANNEFTISKRGTPLNKTYTFRADPKRINIYKEMGIDMVSLANNHIYDYGEEAFIDTLNYLKEEGISYSGAGININEAKKASYFIVNGYKIAFISSTRAEKNIITPGATETESGTFRCYDPNPLIETIKEEKEKSDYVILLIHWGKEDSHEIEEVLYETGKKYIDAGADLIVGSHAHLLQGMEFYNNKLIAYNLGDFIFNRETKDTGILKLTINNEGNMQYNFVPCKQENYKTSLLSDKEKLRVLENMTNYSVNVLFDENGNILNKN